MQKQQRFLKGEKVLKIDLVRECSPISLLLLNGASYDAFEYLLNLILNISRCF